MPKKQLYRRINCEDRMPPNDLSEDYPQEYIFIGKHEDPRSSEIVEMLHYGDGCLFVKEFEIGRTYWLEEI